MATFLGMIPGTLFLVYLGRSANSLKDILTGKVMPNLNQEVIMFILTGIIIVLVLVYTFLFSKNILNKIMREQEQNLEYINEPVEIIDEVSEDEENKK